MRFQKFFLILSLASASALAQESPVSLVGVVLGTGLVTDPAPNLVGFSVGLEIYDTFRVSCGMGFSPLILSGETESRQGCGVRIGYPLLHKWQPYIGASIVDYRYEQWGLWDNSKDYHERQLMVFTGVRWRQGKHFEISGGLQAATGRKSLDSALPLHGIFPTVGIAVRF